jgi:hypothetical protein
MASISIETLDIRGYSGEAVPNTFFRQEAPATHLGIVLPGVGYTAHMPLLYYCALVMRNRGLDVLAVEYSYARRADFMQAAEEERARWFIADVTAAVNAALAQGDYQQVTLVGKSLGTLGMGYLVSTDERFNRVGAVWLTPLLTDERLYGQITRWGGRSLFVIGSADPHYDPHLLAEVQSVSSGEAIVVDGADHSLEIPGDALASLRALELIVRELDRFL